MRLETRRDEGRDATGVRKQQKVINLPVDEHDKLAGRDCSVTVVLSVGLLLQTRQEGETRAASVRSDAARRQKLEFHPYIDSDSCAARPMQCIFIV